MNSSLTWMSGLKRCWKLKEINTERYHEGVTNHMSGITHWLALPLCMASLFHCSASLLSANVLRIAAQV